MNELNDRDNQTVSEDNSEVLNEALIRLAKSSKSGSSEEEDTLTKETAVLLGVKEKFSDEEICAKADLFERKAKRKPLSFKIAVAVACVLLVVVSAGCTSKITEFDIKQFVFDYVGKYTPPAKNEGIRYGFYTDNDYCEVIFPENTMFFQSELSSISSHLAIGTPLERQGGGKCTFFHRGTSETVLVYRYDLSVSDENCTLEKYGVKLCEKCFTYSVRLLEKPKETVRKLQG